MHTTTAYDTGRAQIDTLLQQGRATEALEVAARLFPNQRTLLDSSLRSGNLDLFREVCAIPSGSHWQDGQYVPGRFQGFADTGVDTIRIAPNTAPAPESDTYTPGEVVRAFMPAFTAVACIGLLIVGLLVLVVVAGSALSGLATGISTAFAVIGQHVGYGIALLLGLGALILIIQSAQADTAHTPIPAPPSGARDVEVEVDVRVKIKQ